LAYWLAHAAPRADISWHPVFLYVLGIVLMVIGVVFRWYAVVMLGKYFSVRLAIQPGQMVIQAGPYRWIRHPSYTGALITMFGLGLAFTNWLSLISILVAGFIGYSYRVMVEERILIAALGDPYCEYMKRTKRFIPFVY
jgi:protein-S-isoprenylcysteine O-methyltransferase Ste14